MLLLILVACGTEGSGNINLRRLFGVVVSTEGTPLTNYKVMELSTGEVSITDTNGIFVLTEALVTSQIDFLIISEEFQVGVSIEDPPSDIDTSAIEIEVDEAEQIATVTKIGDISLIEDEDTGSSDDFSEGEGNEEDSEEESEEDTERIGPFDSNGNTNSFGIPSGLTGNISQGRRVWNRDCASHHSERGTGYSFRRLKQAVEGPLMRLSVPNRDLANLTAYLNRRSR